MKRDTDLFILIKNSRPILSVHVLVRFSTLQIGVVGLALVEFHSFILTGVIGHSLYPCNRNFEQNR